MNQRLINFVLVFILTILVVQFFFPKPNDTTSQLGSGFYVRSVTPEYIVPMPPTLNLINNTTGAVSIDTCRDMTISLNDKHITNPPAEFCRTINIAPGTQTGFYLQSIH